MVKKVFLVVFAALSMSLAAPVPNKKDPPTTEVHHRQPRPFFIFDNSIPGTRYIGQPQLGPMFTTLLPPPRGLFPFFSMPWSILLPPIPGISGSGLLNERNLIRVFAQTDPATNATLGYYLFNPFENYNLNDIVGLINGNGRSVDDSSFDDGSDSKIPPLTDHQLNELMQMYSQQLNSVEQGATFNTPNLSPTSLNSPSAQGYPYNTSPYLNQFNQYNPYVVPNSNAMFWPPTALNSLLPGQKSAVSGLPFGITAPIIAPSAAFNSLLPGQESVVSGLPFGITAPIIAPSAARNSSLPGQESSVSDLPFGITAPIIAPSTALNSPLPGQESAVSGLPFGITAPIIAPSVARNSSLPGEESSVSNLPFGITAPIIAPSAAFNSPLPGQESAVSGLPFGITAPIFAPSTALNSPLPAQESAVSGLPFGITAPIPGIKIGGEESAGVEQDEDSDDALDGMKGEGVASVTGGVIEEHAHQVTGSVR